MPPESATFTAIRDLTPPEELAKLPPPTGHGPWSRIEHLLARLNDSQDMGNWLFAMAHRGSEMASPPPAPLPRPGVRDASVTPINDDARRYLERVRAGHGSPDVEVEATRG